MTLSALAALVACVFGVLNPSMEYSNIEVRSGGILGASCTSDSQRMSALDYAFRVVLALVVAFAPVSGDKPNN
eukprot:4185468-Amphidinium_carterae.1